MVNRQRLIVTAATFAALGAAAVISAATASADDTSAILADITATEAAATTAFTASAADFAGGDTAGGLTQLFIGVDDDIVGVPNELQVGVLDSLQGATLFPVSDFEFNFAAPATIAASVTEAQTYYAEGTALAATILGLPVSDYADTALDNTLSTIDQFILPEQIQLIAELAYGL